MDKIEARGVIREELAQYRKQSYEGLQRLLTAVDTAERRGSSGVEYYIKVHAVWDNHRGGNLRVFGEINDGWWSAFIPLVECFIMNPEGGFVGE